jgi:glycosyltransferase involved in cell wall biosynthesis
VRTDENPKRASDATGRSPRVSVLVPVYQGERWVEAAIRSIQAQTFSDWELVVCDDGSTDASYAVCERLCREDPRLRLIRNPQNRGLAATMNRLVRESRGELCAVQEQDDRSVPDRLRLEVDAMDRNPHAGVVSGVAEWLDENDRVWAVYPQFLMDGGAYPNERDDLIRYLYVDQSKVVNAAAMIRRALFAEAGLSFDEEARMAIDWQFFVDVAHRAMVYGIPAVLVKMARGKHRQSLTVQKRLQYTQARRCIRLLYERYRNDPRSPIDRRLYRRAMATERVLEARYYGRLRGLALLGLAFWYQPTHARGWKTVREFSASALRRVGLRGKAVTSGTSAS